jgi:CMP-N-acetylneuraminic acid synthetase
MYDLAVVVPVRRGSSRISNKSMLPFGDADSLIEWKLSQLVKVIDPWRIYLSSEDDEFLGIARRFGVSCHKRDLRLATDHVAPFRDVITGIVRDIPHEHIAWGTVVCPLMSPQEYLDSFRQYYDEVICGDHDSLVGVNLMKEYFWSRDGSLNYEATRNHTISQLLPDWFKVTNSIYMCPKADILRQEYFLGARPAFSQLSKLSGVDIDYIEDYRVARALHAIYAEDGLDKVRPDSLIHWPSPLLAAVGM